MGNVDDRAIVDDAAVSLAHNRHLHAVIEDLVGHAADRRKCRHVERRTVCMSWCRTKRDQINRVKPSAKDNSQTMLTAGSSETRPGSAQNRPGPARQAASRSEPQGWQRDWTVSFAQQVGNSRIAARVAEKGSPEAYGSDNRDQSGRR